MMKSRIILKPFFDDWPQGLYYQFKLTGHTPDAIEIWKKVFTVSKVFSPEFVSLTKMASASMFLIRDSMHPKIFTSTYEYSQLVAELKAMLKAQNFKSATRWRILSRLIPMTSWMYQLTSSSFTSDSPNTCPLVACTGISVETSQNGYPFKKYQTRHLTLCQHSM